MLIGHNFDKGEYIVENRSKYIGDKNPAYKSSFEKRFCYFMDHNPKILKWAYEPFEIKYLNIVDKRIHRYFPDFYFEEIDNNQKHRKFLIEVKPSDQTIPPKQPKIRNSKAYKRYMYEAYEFAKNQCKWAAAKKFCQEKGIEFQIITEKSLFNRE